MVNVALKTLSLLADILAFVPGGWSTILSILVTLSFSGILCYLKKQKFLGGLKTASQMKHRASHLLRDKTYDLLKMTKDARENDSNDLLKMTTKELRNTGREFVTLISEMLTSLSGQQVNVCIKAIEKPRKPVLEKENWKNLNVYTLCRSPKGRHESETIPKLESVAENTDFLLIMKDEGNVFYIPNLKKFDKALRKVGNKNGYMNSNKDWTEHYNSAIVVPIRIEMSLISCDESGYDILGFLCADSLSTRAFPEKYKLLYGELMLSFGDDLYHYFDLVTSIGDDTFPKRRY